MALLTSQTQKQLEDELSRVDRTNQGVAASVEQAEELIGRLEEIPGTSRDDAQLIILQAISEAAEAQGGTLEEVWENYPQELKSVLVYTPEDLKKNQTLTVLGTSLSLASFVGSFLLGGIAVARALPIVGKYLPLIRGAQQAGRIKSAANLIELAKLQIGSKIAFLGISMTLLGALGFAINAAVNNWNDVFHWGPTLGLAPLRDILEGKGISGSGSSGRTKGTGAFGEPFVPTKSTTKSAKPKMFQGVVYSGRVSDQDTFVRHVDDQITDDQDLFEDVEINLTRWLSGIGAQLNYEVQAKFDPFDEHNVKRQGHWLTLDLYFSGKGGKRIYVDTVLLGPYDPAVYYPTERISETIREAADAATTPTIIKPGTGTGGGIRTVDQDGNVVEFLPGAPEGQTLGASIEASDPPWTAEQINSGVLSKRTKYSISPQAYTFSGTPGEYLVFQHSDGGVRVLPVTAVLAPGEREKLNAAKGSATASIEAVDEVLRDRYGRDPRSLPQLNKGDVDAELRRQGRINPQNDLPVYENATLDDFLVDATTGQPISGGSTGGTAAPKSNVCAAGTLFEYYQANGEALPSVASRGTVYFVMGLGSPTEYSGTAEQNTRLLEALKRAAGC